LRIIPSAAMPSCKQWNSHASFPLQSARGDLRAMGPSNANSLWTKHKIHNINIALGLHVLSSPTR
jgi:hypothetical protein